MTEDQFTLGELEDALQMLSDDQLNTYLRSLVTERRQAIGDGNYEYEMQVQIAENAALKERNRRKRSG